MKTAPSSRNADTRVGVFGSIARQSEWLYDHFVDWASYSMLASEWKGGANNEE